MSLAGETLKIRVKNDASPYLQQYGKNVRNATATALLSVGKYLRNTLKLQAKSAGKGQGGYLNWPVLNPYTATLAKMRDKWGRRRDVKSHAGRGANRFRYGAPVPGTKRTVFEMPNLTGGTGRAPMSRLINAVESKISIDKLSVRIGFLQPRLWEMMNEMAEGDTIPVTRRSQKMLFAIGVGGLGGLKQLRRPPRPWIEPVFEHERAGIMDRFNARFQRSLKEGFVRQGGKS